MLYLKRMITLIIMVAFAWINNILAKQMSSKFTIQAFGFCIINVLLVALFIYGYHISKSITKNFIVMLIEYLIMAVLIIGAFMPQIDGVIGNILMPHFKLTSDDMSFILMMQLILGYWIVSFVNVFRSVHIKRGNVINSIRYMG